MMPFDKRLTLFFTVSIPRRVLTPPPTWLRRVKVKTCWFEISIPFFNCYGALARGLICFSPPLGPASALLWFWSEAQPFHVFENSNGSKNGLALQDCPAVSWLYPDRDLGISMWSCDIIVIDVCEISQSRRQSDRKYAPRCGRGVNQTTGRPCQDPIQLKWIQTQNSISDHLDC